jgi:hypothetical protein
MVPSEASVKDGPLNKKKIIAEQESMARLCQFDIFLTFIKNYGKGKRSIIFLNRSYHSQQYWSRKIMAG